MKPNLTELIDRLNNSATPMNLRFEVVEFLQLQERQLAELRKRLNETERELNRRGWHFL